MAASDSDSQCASDAGSDIFAGVASSVGASGVATASASMPPPLSPVVTPGGGASVFAMKCVSSNPCRNRALIFVLSWFDWQQQDAIEAEPPRASIGGESRPEQRSSQTTCRKGLQDVPAKLQLRGSG